MGRHRTKHAPAEEWDFGQAIPLAEAARLWHLDRSTIMNRINTGQIACWKPGRDWFVSRASMARIYGEV